MAVDGRYGPTALANGGLAYLEYAGTPLTYKGWVDPTNLVAITTLEDDDLLIVGDDTASGAVKKITFANLKTALALPNHIRYIVPFMGRIKETDADNYGEMQFMLEGYAGMTNTLKGISVIGSWAYGTAGTTQIAVSSGDYNDGADEIVASMAYNVQNTAMSSGSLAIAGTPPYFYVYCKSAAGTHGNVVVQIDLEVT